MILKGSQRGGARQLSAHLLKDENEHIDLVELRGFMASDLTGALDEAHAIAKGTKCQQFLFSLSLNPPSDQVVSNEAFQKAADAVEERLGLSNQPRAIVIHEKEGRRHAHAVWSRIDPERMTAKQLSFFKIRLRDLSREMYLEHGWSLPDGLRDPLLKNPLNFTREEWQQARRTERDPREIKQVMQETWAQSDGLKAFATALEERGFIMAKGDRRGHVAVDHSGEVYSLSRWTGVRTKELKNRLGPSDDLPSVSDANERFRQALTPKLETFRTEQRAEHAADLRALKAQRDVMTNDHCEARAKLKAEQEQRWQRVTQKRAARFRTGLPGIWDHLTGRNVQTREQNQREAWLVFKRDEAERDALIVYQLSERQALQRRVVEARTRQRDEQRQLDRDTGWALRLEARRRLVTQYAQALETRQGSANVPALEP